MARLLKWVSIIIGALIVLIIALLLIVPRFVDINRYKPRIERMVSESTGRAFSIGGDIDLSLPMYILATPRDLRKKTLFQ